jgi:hypothetical protein
MRKGSPCDCLFFWVRPAGRTYLEVKVIYEPDRGNCELDGKGRSAAFAACSSMHPGA